MREIKFRAWDTENKEFIYEAQATYDNACTGLGSLHHESFQEVLEDDSLIVEQYTGLKDKNGKEIYEGDIVRYGRYLRGIIPPEHRTEAVSWWAGEEEYYPCCTTSGFALPDSEDGYEVIGNIHENPELIEKEQQ